MQRREDAEPQSFFKFINFLPEAEVWHYTQTRQKHFAPSRLCVKKNFYPFPNRFREARKRACPEFRRRQSSVRANDLPFETQAVRRPSGKPYCAGRCRLRRGADSFFQKRIRAAPAKLRSHSLGPRNAGSEYSRFRRGGSGRQAGKASKFR